MADIDTPQNEPATDAKEQQPAGDREALASEQHVPYARFKQVNEQLQTLKTQLATLTGEKEQQTSARQTLEQRLAAIESDLTKERQTNQRLKVASDKKLPPELADRLIGSTPEELATDADRLLAFLKPASGPGVPPPSSGGRAPSIDLNAMSAAEIRKAKAEGKIKFS